MNITDDIPKNRLRELRETEGLSQSELAQQAGVSADTIGDAENSRRRISNRVKNKIVRGLNVTAKSNSGTSYTLRDVFPNG
ncbi:MAG: helix-turn-helix transcriptional regulator [Chloroflexota bacterium]|nr:helix-turn-helix transcriptional regulator [Chloroflexota bacterium]